MGHTLDERINALIDYIKADDLYLRRKEEEIMKTKTLVTTAISSMVGELSLREEKALNYIFFKINNKEEEHILSGNLECNGTKSEISFKLSIFPNSKPSYILAPTIFIATAHKLEDGSINLHNAKANLIQNFNQWQESTGLTGTYIERVEHELPFDYLEVDPAKEAAVILPKTETFLQRYAFHKPILLQGASGLGKTFLANKYAEDNSYKKVTLNCHSGLTAIDLIGHYVPQGDGKMAWKDGSVSKAMRLAQTEKVVFIIDEFLRLPNRERNILLTALIADKEGNYQLNTGRLKLKDGDDLGEEEVLYAPKENLCVLATTNRGIKFDTEELDVAMSERFRFLDVELDNIILSQVLEGFDLSSKEVSAISKIIKQTQKMVQNNILNNSVNIRHISEILTMRKKEEPLKPYFVDLIPNLVNYNIEGVADKQQVDGLKRIFDELDSEC